MTGGVGAALDQVLEELPGGDDLVQAALFDQLDEADTGALDAPSPLSAAISPRKRAGPGRPKGSKNRRTEAVAAWLLQQHRHPLAVMMEAYSMAPEELCARIGLRREVEATTAADGTKTFTPTDHYANDVLLEVVKLQLRMAEAVAPYVAQKLPQAVQVDARAGLSVVFAGVSLPARGGSAGVSGEVIEGQMAVRLPFKSDDQVGPGD